MLTGKQDCNEHAGYFMVFQVSAAVDIHIPAVNENLQRSEFEDVD